MPLINKPLTKNEELTIRLQCGEYDGKDIMQAWITIREQAQRIEELDQELAQLTELKDEADCLCDELYKWVADRDKRIEELERELNEASEIIAFINTQDT